MNIRLALQLTTDYTTPPPQPEPHISSAKQQKVFPRNACTSSQKARQPKQDECCGRLGILFLLAPDSGQFCRGSQAQAAAVGSTASKAADVFEAAPPAKHGE